MIEFDPIRLLLLLLVVYAGGWLTAHWRELF